LAVLPDADRALITRVIQRRIKSAWGGCVDPDLRAAIDAADTWADANAGSFNSALPLPARSLMTLSDKTIVLAYVILRRAGLLDTSPED
jgi:hypothetical protein